MSSRILVSLRVAATPGRAFEVFTRDVAVWWRANDLFGFTPEGSRKGVVAFEGGTGGRFIEAHPDGSVFEIGRISAWEPPHRLAFGWRQASFTEDQRTDVEVRFEPVGDQTRVTVEHSGWDSVPAVHVARHGFPSGVFLRRHGEWWGALLAAFKTQIA